MISVRYRDAFCPLAYLPESKIAPFVVNAIAGLAENAKQQFLCVMHFYRRSRRVEAVKLSLRDAQLTVSASTSTVSISTRYYSLEYINCVWIGPITFYFHTSTSSYIIEIFDALQWFYYTLQFEHIHREFLIVLYHLNKKKKHY